MIASIDITGIRYEVDARTRKYVRRKIGGLDRYIPKRARESVTADVKLSQINQDYGNKYQAEAILHVPGKTLVAKDSTLNIMAAIDLVEAKLLAQLRKYKAEVTAKS